VEHDLFGKPVSTFPDHALEFRRWQRMRTTDVFAEFVSRVASQCSGGFLDRDGPKPDDDSGSQVLIEGKRDSSISHAGWNLRTEPRSGGRWKNVANLRSR
jgi:hypothetical protein